jgi:hypothetical protein
MTDRRLAKLAPAESPRRARAQFAELHNAPDGMYEVEGAIVGGNRQKDCRRQEGPLFLALVNAGSGRGRSAAERRATVSMGRVHAFAANPCTPASSRLARETGGKEACCAELGLRAPPSPVRAPKATATRIRVTATALGCLNWAVSARTRVASGRAGVGGIAVNSSTYQ